MARKRKTRFDETPETTIWDRKGGEVEYRDGYMMVKFAPGSLGARLAAMSHEEIELWRKSLPNGKRA